jgi:hypothetical protein
MKSIKQKKCRVCKTVFNPFRSTQVVCNYLCAQLYADELKRKKELKDWKIKKAKMKEDLMSLSDWLKIAQIHFNTYIRQRDKDKPCISCGAKLQGKFDAGHMWSSGGHANLRFDEYNVNGQCVYCNQHLHGNISMYRINFIKRYSEEVLNDLDKKAHETRKFNIQEVKELINIYKNKIKK